MGWPTWCDKVFSRLQNPNPPQTKANQWKIHCPAHDDRHPSATLTYDPSGQKLVIKCHRMNSDCTFQSIVTALGLKQIDFFAPEKRFKRMARSDYNLACTYSYEDEQEQLLYQVCRWVHKETQKKDFNCRRPNKDFDPEHGDAPGNQRWVYDMEGTRRTLYRLPQLIADLQARPDRTVLVVEGEKCVDFCRGLGLCATTNPHGAGKWRVEYNTHLASRNVVIIPDCDDPDKKTGLLTGQSHAEDVAMCLYGVAKSVKILELNQIKPGSGLDDWIEFNGGKPALKALRLHIDDCPVFTPPMSALPEECLELAAAIHRLSKQRTVGDAAAWLGLSEATYHKHHDNLVALVLSRIRQDGVVWEDALQLAAVVLAGKRFL